MSLLAPLLRAFSLAVKQLGDGRILGILGLAIIITLVVVGPFLLVFTSIFGVLNLILPNALTLPYFGEVGFLGMFTEGLVSKTTWLFWTYLMSPLILAIIGVLLDPIVEAVEARHYPDLPKVRRRPLMESISYAVRLFFLMICVSIAAGLIAWITPIPASLVFVLATGYLIAREYFDTVALRRMNEQQAKQAATSGQPTLWILGALIALVLNVPFVSLIAPLIGIAAFTHLLHFQARSPRG